MKKRDYSFSQYILQHNLVVNSFTRKTLEIANLSAVRGVLTAFFIITPHSAKM